MTRKSRRLHISINCCPLAHIISLFSEIRENLLPLLCYLSSSCCKASCSYDLIFITLLIVFTVLIPVCREVVIWAGFYRGGRFVFGLETVRSGNSDTGLGCPILIH